MSREPVAVVNSLVAIVGSVMALSVALGHFNLSPEQVAAIMAVVIAIAELFNTLWARNQVTPVVDPRNADGETLVPR